MADWRSKLRPASFKGVSFQVEGHDNESGRRVHVHEYPNKNISYAEDMGGVSESFVFEAFVIGDDYISQRDSLKNACNSYGAGTLIHPTFGSKQVICTACRISERNTEGRIARFSLSFVETGEQAFPYAVLDFKDQVLSFADKSEHNAISSFLSHFSIKELPTHIAYSVAGVASGFAQKALRALEVANSKFSDVESALTTGTSALDTLTKVAHTISDITSHALNILQTPSVFAQRVSSCMSIISSVLPARDAIRQLKEITNLGVGEQTTTINPNSSAAANKIEIMQQLAVLTQRVGIAHQAKIISSIEFESAAEAQAIMDDFIDQVEEQILLEVPSDDTALQSLKDLRAILVKDIANTIKKLPEVRNIKLVEALPSVVLAYNLYADIDRAPEIVGRNKVRKPGFIPNGKELEVLAK